MNELTLSADIGPAVDLLGKVVGDLQESVSIEDGAITGTLNAVTGYTGFSGDPEEQSGHYIAVKATAVEGATIKALLIGGVHGEVTLDEDGILIARITSTEQKLQFSAITDEGVQTLVWSLTGVTLAE